MYGFRGDAAKAYLTAVEDALSEATTVHGKNPFRESSSIVVEFPELPFRRNESHPYPPEEAHSGGHSTGVGNSNNIVVGDSEYSVIISDILQAERRMGESLYDITREIESLCDTSFVLPMTSDEILILALGLRNALPEFGSFSDEVVIKLQNFVTGILDVG